MARTKRTPLADRKLPDYTKGEEIFNFVSHVVGGVFGIVALVLCVVRAGLHHDPWGVVFGSIYGVSLITLYTISAVYHGLRPERAKKVLQVLDHCTIYFLIAGSYMPVLFCAIRPVSAALAWVLFGAILAISAMAITFTAIDLKKYRVLSMICYIGIGWCIVFIAPIALKAIAPEGLWLLLIGGIAYTVGAVLYGLGRKIRYMHSVFHLFVLAGSILQFFCIYLYIL